MTNKPVEYVYLDVECTAQGGPNKDSPEAHWQTNYPLLVGWKSLNNSSAGSAVVVSDNFRSLVHYLTVLISKGITPCIVAHNAKFDLKYLMSYEFLPWHTLAQCKVWDTMTWEYRASGHTEKMVSLEDLAVLYGIKFNKYLNLGALLRAGTKMQDISTELLSEYLVEDIEGLEKIHKAQLADGYRCDMDYLLPLAEMELNGLYLDIVTAEARMENLFNITDAIETSFQRHIKQSCEWQDGSPITDEDFSPILGTKSKCIKATSPRTLSFLLTGLPNIINVTPKWSVQYKNGYGARYGKVLPSYFGTCTNVHMGYSMDESVLSQCDAWAAKAMLAYRHANKLLSTYLSPMLSTAKIQGTVHPKLNTAVTNTGRLSSSSPNGQNIPPEVRKLIVGDIVEIDFSQLEMVAVACISKDRNLIADLKDGVDIHYNTAKAVFGKDNAKAMRKIAKNVNFGVLYGGKATGLSHQTGVDKHKVQQLIDAFYKNYPGVARWQKAIFSVVVEDMQPYDIKDGEQRYSSRFELGTSGRRFTFIEQKSPSWLRRKTGRKWSFSPQQTSNYPIQGFAGGDIVMEALTRLWRKARGHNIAFIMTVHDSIILFTREDVEPLMDEVIKEVKDHFKLPLDLTYDVTTGDTWQ